MLDLQSGIQRVLIPGGSYARYATTGHIVYGVDGTVWAVPFELDRLEVTGPPVPVVSGVITKSSGAADFGLAENGTLVYLSGTGRTLAKSLVWVDRDGRAEPLDVPDLEYHVPRVSPDGTRLVVQSWVQENPDVLVIDRDGGTPRRLTFDAASDSLPLWSRDGQRIVFYSSRGQGGLFSKAADGTGEAEPFGSDGPTEAPMAWAPDGALVVIDTGGDIGVVEADSRRTKWLLQSEFDEQRPTVSPDGRWMAYDSDESGDRQVYVRPFPNVTEGKWMPSVDGGFGPVWSEDGDELFYTSHGSMMRISVQPGPDFRYGSPEVFFDAGAYIDGGGTHRMYDLAPDGRFIMVGTGGAVSAAGASEPSELIFVQNWFEELTRLVPRN